MVSNQSMQTGSDWQAALRERIAQVVRPAPAAPEVLIDDPLDALPEPPRLTVDTSGWIRPSGPGGAWHRRDFAAVPADIFLRVAYRLLLGRAVDPAGAAGYAPRVRTWLGRALIVVSLATSEEGRRRGVQLVGGRLPRVLEALDRLCRGRLHGALDAWLRWWDRGAQLSGALRLAQAQLLQSEHTLDWMRTALRGTLRAERAQMEALRETVRVQMETVREQMETLRETVREQMETVREQMHAERVQMQKDWETRLEQLAADASAWQVIDANAALAEHEAALAQLQQATRSLRAEVETLRAGVCAAQACTPTRPAEGAAALAPEGDAAQRMERFYLAFEDACRGEAQAIEHKLAPYLPLLPPPPARVVDLGCGRGEWVALLVERGYEAWGVEPSAAMVDRCRQAGLPVVQASGLDWLRAQGAQSIDVLTAFHVAEHLPFGELLAWMEEAARVLRPGGLLIMETPNPENVLVGSHTFYHDPTHRNPLTPTLLQFVYRYAGLEVKAVLRLNPYPPEAKVPGDDALTARVNGHFCGPQDFAVVGVRP